MSVVKHSAERYDIQRRLENSQYHDWAIILISERGGVVSIQSDYGEWGHCWPSHGSPSLKHFLCRPDLHQEYLLRKFAKQKTHFNCEATVMRLKQDILEQRREDRRGMSKEKARRLFDAIDVAQADWSQNADLFAAHLLWGRDSRYFWDHVSDGLCVLEYDPQCKTFLERLWPLFVEELRRELS